MMNIEEIKEKLSELAKKDLSNSKDLFKHPCSVAVRAIDQCVEDINLLRIAAKNTRGKSKRVTVLVKAPYNINV